MSRFRFLTVTFGLGVTAGIVVDIILPPDSKSTGTIGLFDELPSASPNPNVTVRNLNLDIHDSSTFSSIHEGEINQQTMSEYIEMRVTEAKNETIREYQALSTKRDCIPAIADTT